MKNLYNVIEYKYSCDEYGNQNINDNRLIVLADSAESALGYFTKGEGWENYKEEELIGAYNEKASNIIEAIFRVEVLPLEPDVVI
jgi:hypothetical protein